MDGASSEKELYWKKIQKKKSHKEAFDGNPATFQPETFKWKDAIVSDFSKIYEIFQNGISIGQLSPCKMQAFLWWKLFP